MAVAVIMDGSCRECEWQLQTIMRKGFLAWYNLGSTMHEDNLNGWLMVKELKSKRVKR